MDVGVAGLAGRTFRYFSSSLIVEEYECMYVMNL